MIYERDKLIRFAHCDPAGIVFYPRYAELCNEVVEDWFREALGVDFPELHETRRLGIPAVKLEVEFIAPSRYGDVLTFRLSIAKLGSTSLHLAIEAVNGGKTRVRINLKVVLANLDTLRPTPFDDEWRERLAPYVSGSDFSPTHKN
ncbi:thioesterase family protein [Zoogloea sp.]|nr:thioesterase family protein [Zoogloea sp.]MBT9496283.1 acyl-CoA thioesterase [Zoogloea sp.]MDD2668173.1 thioesterase family protein [Zoogloea sp.]